MALKTFPRTSVDRFWAFVNLVRENNSTDVMNALHNILPDVERCDNKEEEDACIVSQTRIAWTLPLKDLTILVRSAIPISSTRRRLLRTWKFIQEQTQNLEC